MNPHQVTSTKSGFKTGLGWGVGLTGAIVSFWLGAPAQGYVLNDWQFDPQTQHLTVTLPDGVTPNYFLLAEPARIVLNLPSTQLGAVQPVQYYQGPIESIRVSQFDAESARVVVEFAPNTILDPRHAELSSNDLAGGTQWTLRPLVEDSPEGTTVTLDPDRTLSSPTPAETAFTAVTGAVGPPTYTADDGIRTDASPLVDDGTTVIADQPPGTLPIDPFASGAEPQVSVPPLADSASPSAVSVPPLADLPEVSAPEAPVVPPSEAPVTSAPEPQVLAQAPVESVNVEADPVPLAVVPAPEPEIVPTAPVEPIPEPVTLPVPTATAAPATVAAEPPAASPAASVPTDPIAETPQSTASTVAIAPPFLAGTTAANTVSAASPVERATIPPPPVAPQPDGTIPFGTPLPDQAKSDTAAISGASQQRSILPVGTLLSLQYPGSTPLVLDRTEPWNEVLILVDDVVDAQTGQVLLTSGTQVLGQFEGFDQSGRRFVVQSIVTPNGDNPLLLAESEWLLGTRTASGNNLATNSGLGAAAVTILSGFSGIGLLGGAALGAATTYATGPQLVTIQPGQIIVVEVVDEILPFQ